jgi:hypothetical protein
VLAGLSVADAALPEAERETRIEELEAAVGVVASVVASVTDGAAAETTA